MKPRIFISSTFYDLKYIREDLANFVRTYDYEPILFEDGDIGYTPGKNLDMSCYEAMKNSDMVILIIGGEYGSTASGEKKDKFKEYISVTRNEFKTAVEAGIPVFTMIDKKVMAEYGVYDANYEAIEKESRKMAFPTTKNINVFRFIREIKGIVNLPIQEFERSSDIKGFISKQWADMFKNYLSYLRNEKENRKIESSVNEMKILIQKMNIMLDSVGKNVLSKENPEVYKGVVNQQEIFDFCHNLTKAFYFRGLDEKIISSVESRRKLIEKLLGAVREIKEKGVFDNGHFMNYDDLSKFRRIFSSYNIPMLDTNMDYFECVYEQSTILYDNKTREEITDALIKDKYFDILIYEK